jgi:TPR repeat protein
MLNAVPLLMFSPVIFSRQMGLFFLASVFLLQEVSAVGSRPDPFRDNLSHMDGTELGDFFLSASLRYANGENSQDWALSFSNLLRAASFGQPQAQHAVASAYSTGLYRGLRVPMDPGRSYLLELCMHFNPFFTLYYARSLVLDYFSTLAGTPEAHMSIGHRYLKGLGVPRSCEKAAIHYEFAANHAAEQILSRGYALRSVQSELTNHIPWLSDDDNESEVLFFWRGALEFNLLYCSLFSIMTEWHKKGMLVQYTRLECFICKARYTQTRICRRQLTIFS